ncbi:interleukin 12 receptor, beta 2a, like isoform X1 [Hippocampus zosterae]|uniref:interleukin 12 receptor, beta 2a, like isoform X1 n=1 Tax=Hippocampus zosterae TaxID=109293 RepID=UPI00223E5FB2|nr:interleukin 12 receptor, beta 2a, like isoform X1 [Hippocampus zosterae]
MAAGWLLSILVVNMSLLFAAAGPLEPPSKPECHIPCNVSCGDDIHCSWNHRFDPQVLTNYSLHWETLHNIEGRVDTGTSLSGLIDRERFVKSSELRVWAQAVSKHGSAKSQVVIFNTGDIMKPSSPVISWSPQDPLEISWSSICQDPHLSLGPCDVRFRPEVEKLWHEEEVGKQVIYEFSGLIQAGLVYEFQVRCSCNTGMMSDWSATHRISYEKAPTGQMNVWRDCGMPATSIDCAMIWKRLPLSQARGHILGYEVKLFSKHSTMALVNISVAEPRGRLVCDELQCYFNSSLKSVSSASISAYNAHGATVPSYLTIAVPGEVRSEHPFDVRMNMANLTVSWELPSQLPDVTSVKEYVVQYKEAGSLLGKGFDWIRVNKSCATVTFTGRFEKHKPYQVSLFAVTSSQESYHISSVIDYSGHGIPAKVRSFKVTSIAATHATLFWEPVLLSMQNGLILHYEIGVHGQTVYNVSAQPQDENKTFELPNLSPGQEYEVWIKAVTKAGPGANVTTSFITKQQEHHELKSKSHVFVLLLLLCLPVILCCLLVLFSFHKGTSKACLCIKENVPDPYNSTIFEMMKYQVNEPLAWICVPIHEPHPIMSMLEVVEIQCPTWERKCLPQDQTTPAVASEGYTKRTHRYGKDEYSKMVDSEEAKDVSGVAGRDDSWSSSEEEPDTSGYEQHFMPTAVEILDA